MQAMIFTAPHASFQTELGARQVEEVLWRMEYGLPA